MGNTPKSIIIIWLITAIAVLLSIISLIGIIISRSDKIKKKVLLDLQKKGLYIQDFSLNIFPASDEFSLYVKGLKLNEISFDSLNISLGKISANGLNFRSLSCGKCDLSLGINSYLDINDLKLQITPKGSGKIDITSICKIKELNKKKISRILSLLSLNLKIHNSSIKIDNAEIVFNQLSSEIYIDYVELYSEYRVMIGNKIPEIPGIVDLWLDLEYLDGTADIKIYEPFNTSGKIDLIFCNEKQMIANYNLLSQPEIKSILEGEKFSAEPNLITVGSLSISNDGEIANLSNIKGYAKDIIVSDQKIGNLDIDISIDYSKDEINFSAKLRSDYINILAFQGKYNANNKNLNLKFSGEFHLDKIPELDLSGKLYANGYLNLPKLKLESDIRLNSFAYDTIRAELSYGKIKISPETIKFDLDIKHRKSDIHWNGEFDPKKQNLESQTKFFHSSLSDLLNILNIDLPIDGISDGEISANILKNKLSILGKITSYRNFVFGEKIHCVYADVSGDVDVKNGNFSVRVKGIGSERNCANRIIEPYDNSIIYFDTNVDSKKFSVSISGIYDLSEFDILKLSMRGNASFSGNLSGYTTGKSKLNGEIDLTSEKVEITDYAVASSCVNGKILISDESIQFQGKSCEDFDIYSIYSLKDSSLSFSASKGETAFSIQNNSITGKGKLEDISTIIPRLKDNIGSFELKYNLVRKDGIIYVISPRFVFGNLKFENLDFFGDIKDNAMIFSVSGIYSGEKFSGKGEYDISSRKIISDFELKSFAGIPLIGKLTVSGTIDKPYISGNFKVKDIDISNETIKDIANISGSQAQNEENKEYGTLNIKVEIQNVEYRASFINLKINGILYIMGTTENPAVFGMLDITDGKFSLADTEFSGIKGTAFVKGENIFLNISGSTDISTFEGEKFRIQIRIVGDINSPKVYLSSIPSIPHNDIVCIIATYRKCDSLDEFNKIMASVIYRNFSLISRRILGDIGESTNVRIIISPTDIGFTRKFGYLDILVMQSIISDIRKFSVSRDIGENYQLILSWDNKKYGYSLLGDIGNIGFDLKRRIKF